MQHQFPVSTFAWFLWLNVLTDTKHFTVCNRLLFLHATGTGEIAVNLESLKKKEEEDKERRRNTSMTKKYLGGADREEWLYVHCQEDEVLIEGQT